jgi:hypothetical protein
MVYFKLCTKKVLSYMTETGKLNRICTIESTTKRQHFPTYSLCIFFSVSGSPPLASLVRNIDFLSLENAI